jgi:hypothetical protein
MEGITQVCTKSKPDGAAFTNDERGDWWRGAQSDKKGKSRPMKTTV